MTMICYSPASLVQSTQVLHGHLDAVGVEGWGLQSGSEVQSLAPNPGVQL